MNGKAAEEEFALAAVELAPCDILFIDEAQFVSNRAQALRYQSIDDGTSTGAS
jgi:hypothetical protein